MKTRPAKTELTFGRTDLELFAHLQRMQRKNGQVSGDQSRSGHIRGPNRYVVSRAIGKT